MNKKVGFFGLLLVATVSVFHPAVASAQNRYDGRRAYAPTEASDRAHGQFRQYDDRQHRRDEDRRFQQSGRRDEGCRVPRHEFISRRGR